jgi:hypothetical protein
MHGPRVPSEGHGLATMAAPMPTAGTCRARLCLAVRPWAARRVGATAGTMTWGATGPELGPGGREGPSAHLSRHRTPGVGLPGMPGASCRRGCARGPSRPQCLDLLSGDASRRHQLGVAVGIDATMVARPCPSQMMRILCITPSLPNLVVSCAHGHGFGQPPPSWCPLDAYLRADQGIVGARALSRSHAGTRPLAYLGAPHPVFYAGIDEQKAPPDRRVPTPAL